MLQKTLYPLYLFSLFLRKHSINFLKCIICILAIIFWGNNFHRYKERPAKNITIFVHGTLMPFLALLNPLKTYAQTIKPKDWYYKCLQALRGDSELLYDSIILEEGLKEIDPLILYQCSKLGSTKIGSPTKGAYKAIGAYDIISKFVNNKEQDIFSYYTFGFNGILSHTHRKEASLKFYEEITKLVTECLKNGYRPIINICGYSHGGNVTLLLAHAELIHKKNLQIERVILFGTPIQAETAIYANHPMFSKIYNFFSEGDNVQNSDSFSTSSASSYRTFKELSQAHHLEILSKNIYDIKISIAENSTILGHFSYWFFNKYSDSWATNFSNFAQLVLNIIYPYPIAIFAPLFLNLIEQSKLQLQDLNINFKAENELLEIELLDNNTKEIIGTSVNIFPILSKIKKYTGSSNARREINNSSTSTILRNLGTGINTIISSLIDYK